MSSTQETGQIYADAATGGMWNERRFKKMLPAFLWVMRYTKGVTALPLNSGNVQFPM